ncbi:tyrosine-type recombinase/integrase [Streptomyces sp. NPDC056255]|uniref:tyrosine-type recombinase/integrase n=1 Tax=Streptomyces sp. NPDC056255 TaxID=3345764 RepID=UPI0035D9CF67
MWGTANRPAPTGTCRRPRNFSRWPPPGATGSERQPAHNPDRAHPADVLHRPARPTAQASPRTIAAYRDALRLLLGFVQQRTGTAPAKLDWNDLNADVISAFLDHLEDERGNSTRTRNVRLTAIRSLFSYAALQHPEHALLIQRVLDIPPKPFDKRTMTFLTSDEVDALLAAPDPKLWEGRRDKAMLALAVQTGLRVTELTSLNCDDITIGDGAAVRCEGKGRKQRTVPLDRPVQHLLRSWLNERAGHRGDPLFCTRNGCRLSRDAVAQRVRKTGGNPDVLHLGPVLVKGVDVKPLSLWIESLRSSAVGVVIPDSTRMRSPLRQSVISHVGWPSSLRPVFSVSPMLHRVRTGRRGG